MIDTGVAFNPEVVNALGADVADQFLGQANFVGDGKCETVRYGMVVSNGPAIAGPHENNSEDPYGHGTHIAGVIGINLSSPGWSRI